MKKMTTLPLLALAALLAGPLSAGKVSEAVAKVQHALGWDTVNLKTVEADNAGRATLERDENDLNRVQRRTRYHDSTGKKAFQETLVEAKDSGKNLYHEKKSWDESGDLESHYEEDAAFSGDRRTKGVIVEKRYERGRLVKETRRTYSPEAGEWTLAYAQVNEYYPDGDLKERVTERPGRGEKKRETWGESKKGAGGRSKTTRTWDEDRERWD